MKMKTLPFGLFLLASPALIGQVEPQQVSGNQPKVEITAEVVTVPEATSPPPGPALPEDEAIEAKMVGRVEVTEKPELLWDCLGVRPGAVTPFGLINDRDNKVQLWVDADVWAGEDFMCHPLVNTATELTIKVCVPSLSSTSLT